jgi:hypothetical protein
MDLPPERRRFSWDVADAFSRSRSHSERVFPVEAAASLQRALSSAVTRMLRTSGIVVPSGFGGRPLAFPIWVFSVTTENIVVNPLFFVFTVFTINPDGQRIAGNKLEKRHDDRNDESKGTAGTGNRGNVQAHQERALLARAVLNRAGAVLRSPSQSRTHLHLPRPSGNGEQVQTYLRGGNCVPA